MNKVLPSILKIKDAEELNKFLDVLVDLNKRQISDIKAIHLDIMDGIFVDNKCLNIDDIKMVKEKGFIADVHLMVENPKELIEKSIELGANSITIHYEITEFYDMLKLLFKYREKYNINVGVSISPDTDVKVLEPIINKLDSILIMSVYPGKGGQEFIDRTYDKIRKTRNLSDKIRIVVDGGVNNTNMQNILEAGANNVVIGNYLTSNFAEIEEKINKLNGKRFDYMKKIAIMTAGGDCCGLNAAIKTVVYEANLKGIEVIGVLDGFKGFVEGKNKVLTLDDVYGIETVGGTILGSSNKECPFYYLVDKEKEIYEDLTNQGINHLTDLGVEGLIVIGGDGTLDSARVIHERGLPTIGIAKTIDNDMIASDCCIGFETAISNNVESIEKIKSTAFSHKRVMVVEVMGRTSGYLTLYSGFASGADMILLPEKDYNLDIVCERARELVEKKRYAIIAISEAAKEIGKTETVAKIIEDSFIQQRYGGVAQKLAEQIEEKTGIETRAQVLGYTQRGGTTIYSDIINASLQADYALELLLDNQAGYIVGVKQGNVSKMEFPKIRVPRILDFDTNKLIKTAKNMGISFGI